jgi:hypothetical protein
MKYWRVLGCVRGVLIHYSQHNTLTHPTGAFTTNGGISHKLSPKRGSTSGFKGVPEVKMGPTTGLIQPEILSGLVELISANAPVLAARKDEYVRRY